MSNVDNSKVLDIEDRLEAVEEEMFFDDPLAVTLLDFERVGILESDVKLRSVSAAARALHTEAVKMRLSKPGSSFLTLWEIDGLPGASLRALRELEESGLFSPVWFSSLGIPAGYDLPLVKVLCGFERHEDMPWHPDYVEIF